jgi:hypothetical protein
MTNKPWLSDSCNEVKNYFTHYTVQQAALLWCGVAADEVWEELEKAKPVSDGSSLLMSVLRHPYIPCLEPRCRVLQDAIDNSKLAAGRDGGKPMLVSETGHIAYARRTLNRENLKAWIGQEFPNDKPAFLFDEIERKTHPSINADSFRALQVDRDALKVRVENAVTAYSKLIAEKNSIQAERDSLKAMLETNLASSKDLATRERNNYLKIIGGACIGLQLDLSMPSKAAGVIESLVSQTGQSLGQDAITEKLKQVVSLIGTMRRS